MPNQDEPSLRLPELPQRSSSKPGLIAVLILLVLVVLGGVWWFTTPGTPTQAQHTTTTFGR